MKIKEKIFLFLFLIIYILTNNTIGVFTLKGDCSKNVPRVVLIELFVQENCPTCPTVEFCLEDLAWEYGTGKIILVEEHLWSDGYDTPEINSRYNWYVGKSKKGTPDVFINGLTKRIQGLACDCIDENYTCYKEIIDKELTRHSLVELSASKTISNSTIVIKGRVKSVSNIHLKNLAVCGMIYKEGNETGLNYWVQDIFPFQSVPSLSPQETFVFSFVSEPLFWQEDDKDEFRAAIFVQDIETKEVLQSLYVE